MKKFLLSLLFLLATPAFSASGLLTLNSDFDVATTVDRLEEAVKKADFRVFARIDHSAGAKTVGLDLRQTQLLIFGKPKAGSLLMQQAQSVGIDLPMKYLVWQDENGKVFIGWNDPGWITQRHAITGQDGLTGKMSGALQKFASQAAKAP